MKRRVFGLFLALKIVLSTAGSGQIANISPRLSTIKTHAQDPLAAAKTGLEIIEDGFDNAARWTRQHRRTVKAAASTALLFHGGRFSHSMLLFQTVKVTAGPTIVRAARDLSKKYREVRDEVKKQAPQLETAKELLDAYSIESQKLQKDVAEIRSLAKSGAVSKDELKSKLLLLKSRRSEIIEHSEKLNAVLFSASAVATAVDVDQMKSLANGVFTACASCLTTVTSKTAASITIGVNLGNNVIGNAVQGIVIPFIDKVIGSINLSYLPGPTRKWVEAGIASAASITGVFVALQMKQSALVLSTCSLGSQGLLAALNDTSTHVLGHSAFPSEGPVLNSLHLALTLLGFFSQITGARNLNPVVSFALSPLLWLETTLRGLSARALAA